ncbi:hypothetical protein [Amycolatopsis sp. lyj-23]|uniref:hypothetical protein n=1 Tax=Amycolatopsis sp. lyj-23 TaxID=2789283 RepID=UPI003979F116
MNGPNDWFQQNQDRYRREQYERQQAYLRQPQRPTGPPVRQRRAGRRGPSPLVVFVFSAVGLLVGEAVNWFKDVGPVFSSVCTVVAGLIPLLLDYWKSVAEEPAPGRGRAGAPSYDRGGTAAGRVLGVLVFIVVAGAAAYGISWGVGYVTGNETVRAERLVSPVAGRADSMTITVEGVGVTDHYTKVRISAVSRAPTAVDVGVGHDCQLVDDGGQTLQPSTVANDQTLLVPANGVTVRAVITFTGRPAPTATTLTLDFSWFLAHDFGFGAHSLQVHEIKLKADPA